MHAFFGGKLLEIIERRFLAVPGACTRFDNENESIVSKHDISDGTVKVGDRQGQRLFY